MAWSIRLFVLYPLFVALPAYGLYCWFGWASETYWQELGSGGEFWFDLFKPVWVFWVVLAVLAALFSMTGGEDGIARWLYVTFVGVWVELVVIFPVRLLRKISGSG
ncbi:MAG: hypothetical protein DWQ31_06730 [Planctomycetota bacterium]|nr:MAG: hypothetical protein DWQ31_06730 [Planctomycetota bacterium]REJ90329.1 MAG: hypothetical protein DWQ35_16775 [Planctomycetota bacterium]